MSAAADIQKFLKLLIEQPELKVYPKVCTVTEVDATERTCDVKDLNGNSYFDIRLQATPSGSTGVVTIPSVESYVIVHFLNEKTGYVAEYTDVDEVLIDCEVVKINGGENGGLLNITEVVKKFNALESEVNQLKTLIKSWTPVANDGGSALKVALTSWSAGQVQTTTQTELEDTKVTH